jgi:hypothetical protein
MVLNRRWCFRLGAIIAVLAPGGILSAQIPATNSLPALQQSVAQRTAEWNALATNLELRVVRLLPCDPQARAAIEETRRASDARTLALTNYWNQVSSRSKAQVEAIRGLLAKEEARAGDWAEDADLAKADVAFATAQSTSLASGVPHLPALANPQKDLEAIAEQYSMIEKQTQVRAAGAGRLLDDLRELLKASDMRQAAIDERLRTVGVEGQRWGAYYAARQARAQIECSLVTPAGASAPAAVPRAMPPGKKQ